MSSDDVRDLWAGAEVMLPSVMQGAVPDPLVVQALGADGAPRDLTGFTVKGQLQRIGQAAVEVAGALFNVDATNDGYGYTFVTGDLATAGTYRIAFWASDGTTVLTSPVYVFACVAAPAGAAPTFP